MLEQYLINHCAPTLASLKTANLFNCTAENPTALQMASARWQALLEKLERVKLQYGMTEDDDGV